MSENDHPRTTRDALILEAIGDIGELIRRIEVLNSTAVPLVAALEKTQMDAMAVVEQHASKKQDEFRVFT
ncbi:MAG: hypothetical protein ACXWTY_09565 [Methylobacter sp.]